MNTLLTFIIPINAKGSRPFAKLKELQSQRTKPTTQFAAHLILPSRNNHLIENLQLKENDFLKRAAILLFHSNPEKAE